jgi:hypothetical protein
MWENSPRTGLFRAIPSNCPNCMLVTAGHKAIAIRCDVSDEAQVEAMVEQSVSSIWDRPPISKGPGSVE